MCECLEYEDGDMYLCVVDADMYREFMELRATPTEVAALRAENARLRAAIVEYAIAAEQFVGPTNGRYADARSALLRIAGEAP